MGTRLRTQVPGLQHPWPPWDLSPLTPLCPPTLIGPRAPRGKQGLRSGFLEALVTSRTFSDMALKGTQMDGREAHGMACNQCFSCLTRARSRLCCGLSSEEKEKRQG